MKVFILCGEESGDILGAELMQALLTRAREENLRQDVVFRGIGGTRMQEQGLKSLFPMEELSVMGIFEIAPKIPHLLKRISQTADAIEAFAPDLLITIDAPDFSFRVAKEVEKRSLSIRHKTHYVAPTVWAWRPGRAKKIAKLYDSVLCLFPFEPPYFEAEGMLAPFIGHPMSARLSGADTSSFIEKHHVEDKRRIGVLFGSRKSELNKMGGVFIEALKPLLSAQDDSVLIVPTLPHLENNINKILQDFDVEKIIVTSDDEKFAAMAACDVALATSGTVGLELSVLGVPHVIGYKMNALTYEVAKYLMKTPYAHLSNIMLREGIVPEFIQHKCNAENLTQSLNELLTHQSARQAQLEAFERVRDMIKAPGGVDPSVAAAGFLINRV